jgi:membrane peptidoglycan carboxypeptidase
VARQAAQILTQDTQGQGTSAQVFSGWDGAANGYIAGKTGTNQAYPKDSENSSVWFVGMTPKLVAATAVVNFDSSSAPSSGLKGEGKGKAYGDFAAKVWWDALKPAFQGRSWNWPDPNNVDGEDVPDVKGLDYGDAKAALAEKGFKIHNLAAPSNFQCASSEPFDTVGYYGPQRAKPGSVITVCLSTSIPQYTPPKIVKPTHNTGNTGHGNGNGNGNGNGGNSGGGRNGGGGGGNGPGGGGGGGGHQPGGGGNGPGHGGGGPGHR